MEVWLPIKDFSNYEVSSEGRIRNVVNGRVLKPFSDTHGYCSVTLYKNGKRITKKVHRIVADTFYDGDRFELTVNHIDGDKANNSVSNLEWCSLSENIQHAYDTRLRKPPRMERVRVVETDEKYESLSDCARAINGTVSGIHDCKTGRQSTHRGYHFDFIDEEVCGRELQQAFRSRG